MIKLLKIELQKTLNYIPFRILILLHLVFFVFGIFFIPRIKFEIPFVTILPLYQFPHVWNFTTWISSIYNISLILLVIMLTSNEFTNRTYKQQVIFGLSRDELLIQKIFLLLFLSFYDVLLVGVSSVMSGMVYSYKMTLGLAFERAWIMPLLFIQIFTYLCYGLLFSLIFKNMILSGVTFLMYRVIVEPIIRMNVDENIRNFFPFKFLMNLTPPPKILDLIQKNIDSNGPPPDPDQNPINTLMPKSLEIWQNLLLTIVLMVILLLICRMILKKRQLN
jgi:hypothetical protein